MSHGQFANRANWPAAPLARLSNLHGMLGKEHTPIPFRAKGGCRARCENRTPPTLEEAGSPPPKENIPNVTIPRRAPANPCQFLKFFLYDTIQLAGAILAASFYRPIKRSLWP